MLKIIAGKLRGHTLTTASQDVRPTQGKLREALFNITASWIEGSHVLDLFAGSGAIGFEALSRGAASATFVDNSRRAACCIKANIDKLKVQKEAQLLVLDAMKALEQLSKEQRKFDLIFIDPPYADVLSEKAALPVQLLQRIALDQLLAKEGDCFLEAPQRFAKQLENLSFEEIELKKVRHYGSALLAQFNWKEKL